MCQTKRNSLHYQNCHLQNGRKKIKYENSIAITIKKKKKNER